MSAYTVNRQCATCGIARAIVQVHGDFCCENCLPWVAEFADTYANGLATPCSLCANANATSAVAVKLQETANSVVGTREIKIEPDAQKVPAASVARSVSCPNNVHLCTKCLRNEAIKMETNQDAVHRCPCNDCPLVW